MSEEEKNNQTSLVMYFDYSPSYTISHNVLSHLLWSGQISYTVYNLIANSGNFIFSSNQIRERE